MSYDIWFEADLGGPCPAHVEPDGGDWHWNYTSNCARMWRDAMADTDGLAGLHGMRAGDAAVHLRGGVARMEADPETYRAMNPKNGWGSFDTQLEALRELLHGCLAVPDAKVVISR